MSDAMTTPTSEPTRVCELREYLMSVPNALVHIGDRLQRRDYCNVERMADEIIRLRTALANAEREREEYKEAMRANQMTADAPYLKRHLAEMCKQLNVTTAEALPREIDALQRTVAGISGAPMPTAFVKYVTSNYRQGCVISDPLWHAPKLWRAAMHALAESTPTREGSV